MGDGIRNDPPFHTRAGDDREGEVSNAAAIREMLHDVLLKLDRVSDRLAIIEARKLLEADLDIRFIEAIRLVSEMGQRFAVHEAANGHAYSLRKLEEHDKARAEIESELRTIRVMAGQIRWFASFAITTLVALAVLGVQVIRLSAP